MTAIRSSVPGGQGLALRRDPDLSGQRAQHTRSIGSQGDPLCAADLVATARAELVTFQALPESERDLASRQALEEAGTLAARAVALNIREPDALNTHALIQLALGNRDNARKLVEIGRKIDPSLVEGAAALLGET